MILRRYVLRRMASRTLFIFCAGLALYVVVDMMGIAQHLGRGSALDVLRLYLLRLPEMARTLLPVALVLGPMLAMGSLAKRFELAAIKFCGGAMARIVAPALLLVGLASAAVEVGLSEWALPQLTPRAVAMQDRTFRLRGPRFWTFYRPRRWLRTPEGFLHTRNLRRGVAHGVTYVQHDAGFAPRLLIRAERLEPRGEGYLLQDGVRRDLRDLDLPPQPFAELAFPEQLAPQALAQHLGYPEIFSLARLRRVIATREAQGGPVAPFKLALWRRLGDPLLLLALALLVVPVASWSRRGQPTERRLIEGAGVIGLYFALRGGFGSLASASTLGSAAAGLGPAVLTLLLAAAVWRRVEAEHLLR